MTFVPLITVETELGKVVTEASENLWTFLRARMVTARDKSMISHNLLLLFSRTQSLFKCRCQTEVERLFMCDLFFPRGQRILFYSFFFFMVIWSFCAVLCPSRTQPCRLLLPLFWLLLQAVRRMCQPLQVEKTRIIRIWIDLMNNVFCKGSSCNVNLCKIDGFLLCFNINLSKVARQAWVPVKIQCVPTKCQYCNSRVLTTSASANTLLIFVALQCVPWHPVFFIHDLDCLFCFLHISTTVWKA